MAEATERDYVLNQDLFLAFGKRAGLGGWDNQRCDFTGSIDAAVALVAGLLPTHDTSVYRDREAGIIMVGIVKPLGSEAASGFVAHHETEPLATLLSMLRVLGSLKEEEARG